MTKGIPGDGLRVFRAASPGHRTHPRLQNASRLARQVADFCVTPVSAMMPANVLNEPMANVASVPRLKTAPSVDSAADALPRARHVKSSPCRLRH